MRTAKLSTNGRVTIPKGTRDAQRWKTGKQFTVELVAEGVLLQPLNPVRSKTPQKVLSGNATNAETQHDRGRY